MFYIGGNTIFVPTFSPYSHFDPYFLFLPLLVPILKSMFHFGLYRHLTNGNILCDKQIIVLAYYPFIGMVIKCSSHYPFIVENLKWQPFIGLTL